MLEWDDKVGSRFSPVQRRWLGYALLAGVTLLCYVPALWNGYIWDDDNYVTANVTLRSLEGLRRIWLEPRSIPQYYPLVHTSFWLEYQLWGLQPMGYHLVNILLHIGGAMLLWRLLRELAVPGAWLGALLFAVHPVQVESVAWVTERKNVLSLVFYLATLLVYLRMTKGGAAAWWRTRRGWLHYGLAMLLFVAALLSKTVTSTLPAALVVLLLWRDWPVTRRDWRMLLPLVPFFVIGLAMAWVTILLERQHVGAMGSEWDFSLVERCLIAGQVVWFYAAKLLWPEPLIFIYPRWQIDSSHVALYLYPAALLAVLIWLWVRRRRWGLGPLVAVLLFIGTLTPALGFFNVYPMRYSFVADHFQYHASIWLLALFGALLHRLCDRWPRLALLLPALIMGLGLLTARHTLAFRDEPTLWRDVLAKNDSAWIAHNNLGLAHLHQGDYQSAITRFQSVLSLRPDHSNAPINLALALEKTGNIEEARRWYQEGLQRNFLNPLAINEVGNFFARQGEAQKAVICYRQALALRPHDLSILMNLATALEAAGQHESALSRAREAHAMALRYRADAPLLHQLQSQIDRLTP